MRQPAAFLSLLLLLILPAAASAQGIDQLWTSNCALCHGPGAQGGGAGAGTLLDDKFTDQAFDKQFFQSIKGGLPDKGMAAFGETMSDPQIWAMVVHIRELQARERRQRTGSPKAQDGVYSSQRHRFRIETVVPSGLSVPWAVDFLPGGDMLITERPGDLRILKNGALSRPVAGTPAVRNRGQGGLMDVAVHPNYKDNGWIYLAYSDELEQGGKSVGLTKIVRGRITPSPDGSPAWTDQETIFQPEPAHYSSSEIHFGCRIVFDPQNPGILFFPIGERGSMELSPNLSRPNGKVHRLTDDGKIPQDNPFAGQPDALPSIWTYGHRNPQGLTFDLEGNLWDTEHGPRGGDEVNLILKGRNYGWPTVSFGINYSGAPFKTPWPEESSNIAMPAYRWLPSIGACGLDVARGPAFPDWKGDLLAGGLSGANVDRLRMKDGRLVEREEIVHGLGRVRDVACGPDGTIYVVLNGPDKIVRLVPAD